MSNDPLIMAALFVLYLLWVICRKLDQIGVILSILAKRTKEQ